MTTATRLAAQRASLFAVLIGGSLLLQGCVVGAVVGTGAAVVGAGAKVTGAAVGAGFDAVTTSDEETRARREREERDAARAERRCQQRQAQGKAC